MKFNLFFATFAILVLTGGLAAQASQKPSTESFTWSGELVALDESARTVTVKAPVWGDQAVAELPRLKPGDKIFLTWSGFFESADAVLRVAAETAKFEDRFTFPVEFVSFDASRKYVTFKVKIPESGPPALKSLKPGEWITGMTPQGVASKTAPVSKIRPYVGSF